VDNSSTATATLDQTNEKSSPDTVSDDIPEAAGSYGKLHHHDYPYAHHWQLRLWIKLLLTHGRSNRCATPIIVALCHGDAPGGRIAIKTAYRS
jgi:hypothetical protein